MISLSLLIILTCFSFNLINGSKHINKYNIDIKIKIKRNEIDDECKYEIDEDLVNEIKSYKEITKYIMDQVTYTYGDQLYTEYTNFLDTFGPRLAGSQALEDSIDYMINLTKQYGLDDVITEEVDVPHWVRGKETLQMIKPRLKKMQILGNGFSVSTPSEGITAEAIVFNSLEEFKNLETDAVKGKILVINIDFLSISNLDISQILVKTLTRGAVAVLLRSMTTFSLYSPHTGEQMYLEDEPKIPVAAITVEDSELLWRLQCKGKKIVLTLKMSNSLNSMKTSRNVLIDLKGDEFPEKLVIVSGHIDSWDVGDGAIDDGGGMFISWFVPVMLNNLRRHLRRTVRAILWTAEEVGLLGAYNYLDRHKDDLSSINFMLESDYGTFKPLGLAVNGSKTTHCILAEILKLFPYKMVNADDIYTSDISVFLIEKIPGAYLMTQDEKYFWFHHTEADTLLAQNKSNVIECAAFWTALSYVIADLSINIPRD